MATRPSQLFPALPNGPILSCRWEADGSQPPVRLTEPPPTFSSFFFGAGDGNGLHTPPAGVLSPSCSGGTEDTIGH